MDPAQTPVKAEWPELLNIDGDEAVTAIKEGHPELTVHKVKEGSAVTMDMRFDRVRVWVNEEGKVNRNPKLG